jgi:hypothetical protein
MKSVSRFGEVLILHFLHCVFVWVFNILHYFLLLVQLVANVLLALLQSRKANTLTTTSIPSVGLQSIVHQANALWLLPRSQAKLPRSNHRALFSITILLHQQHSTMLEDSIPPPIPKPPIHHHPRHSNRLPHPLRLEPPKPDIQRPWHRLAPRVPPEPLRRLAPLAVEERLVASGAAVDGPVGRFDPLAEVVAAFLDRALDVGGEVLEDGDEEAVGEDVGLGIRGG